MEKTLRYRCVILVIAFISQSFGAIWNLQKIVPALPELMKTWGIGLESASLLAAIYGNRIQTTFMGVESFIGAPIAAAAIVPIG